VAAHSDPRQPSAEYSTLLGGLHTAPALITDEGRQSGIQPALTPRGARVLLGGPAGQFAGLDMDASAVLGRFAGELRERVGEQETWTGRFGVLDTMLGERAGAADCAAWFPLLTHTEEGLYAQIADSVPDAAPSRVDRELDDNEVLDAIGARVLSTPGHTEGSIALHFPTEAVLFTGDISFRRFADIDVATVCFGHGQPLRGDDTAKLRAAATANEIPDPLG
jgi:hypothetical protein